MYDGLSSVDLSSITGIMHCYIQNKYINITNIMRPVVLESTLIVCGYTRGLLI